MQAFLVSFALTLAGLAITVTTGLRGRVRAHIACVTCTLVLLGATVYFAEKLGERYDLASAGAITPVHLFLAKAATLSFLLPIASGVATLRDRRRRRVHLALACTALLITLAAAGTGAAMILLAEPLQEGALSHP